VKKAHIVSGVAVAAAAIFVAVAATSAEIAIRQKGKVFSEKEVSIKKGDTLVFVNDDNITHNVMSITKGHQFNLGATAPGNSTPVTFNSAGEIAVICAMHPTMKMTVKVAD
jgi:plastocyanin